MEFTDLLFTPNAETPRLTLPALTKNTSLPEQTLNKPEDSETTETLAHPNTDKAPSVTTNPKKSRSNSKRCRAITDYSTSMWVHNGLTAKEKATACLDMSKSYTNKTWMARFRIAMSVNESTLKRKLKEGAPLIPVTRNEQGRLYHQQYHTPKPKTRSSNFAAQWTNSVDTNDAATREENAAFRNKGLHNMLKEKTILLAT